MQKFHIFLCILVMTFTACSLKSPQNESDEATVYVQEWGTHASNFALLKKIDKYTGTRKGGDCSGFISVLNKELGGIYFDEKTLPKYFGGNGRKSQAMFNYYKAKGKLAFSHPSVGDLIFFSNTTNGTKHRKKISEITHVGVVRKIYSDGRIEFAHFASNKNEIAYMNLKQKDIHTNDKKIMNSYISRCRGALHCLASNKFAGYGKLH